MNESMAVAQFFPQIHFRSTWFTYGTFLKVIRIAVGLSVFSNAIFFRAHESAWNDDRRKNKTKQNQTPQSIPREIVQY